MISREEAIEELERIKHDYCYEDCLKPDHDCTREDDCTICAVERMREFIESQPPADQWISCSSGVFPTEKGWYWVTEDWGGGETRLLYYIPKLQGAFEEYIKLKYGGVEVTAWMPATLPEPYKGVE